MHRHGGPLLAPPAPAGALRQNRRVRRCLLGARQETALWCLVGSVCVGGGYWVPLIQDVRAVPPAWFVGCYLCVAPDRTLRVGGQRRGGGWGTGGSACASWCVITISYYILYLALWTSSQPASSSTQKKNSAPWFAGALPSGAAPLGRGLAAFQRCSLGAAECATIHGITGESTATPQ